MIDFFIEQLNLSPIEVQRVDLNKDFQIDERKVIYFNLPINKVNYFQQKINSTRLLVSDGQYVIFRFETIQGRIRRIQKKQFRLLSVFIVATEFVLHRVFPKIFFFKFLYSKFTKSRIRVLSKAEALGRIVSAGFEIITIGNSNSLTYAIFKVSKTIQSHKKPSYGPFYSMPRIGKNGKIIQVYKIRTMHPYSEFLHEFMIKQYGYGTQGKPKNDFRVTSWGKYLRKFWIDEIPQLINILKGEMKLVGLRPVSEVYYSGLSEDLKIARVQFKPGCIPPYVAFNSNSSRESVIDAEKKYILLKQSKPYSTDIVLFFKAIYYILIKKKRGS